MCAWRGRRICAQSRRAAGAVTQSGAKRRRGEAEANIDLADCDDVVAE
jgi:hypothetical protein